MVARPSSSSSPTRGSADRGELQFPEQIDPATVPGNYQAWLDRLYAADWVVNSKPPFGGAEHGLG